MATILDGPRLPITDDNRSGLIVIITATAVAWTLTVLTIRISSVVSVRRPFGLEEAAVTLSSVRDLSLFWAKLVILMGCSVSEYSMLFCDLRCCPGWPRKKGYISQYQ